MTITDFELLPWQEEFILNEQPHAEVSMGRGAGKTTALLLKAIRHAERHDKASVGLFFPDWQSTSWTWDQYVVPWAEANDIELRRMTMQVRLPNESIITFGYKQRAKEQVFASRYTFIGVDSADLWGPHWPMEWHEAVKGEEGEEDTPGYFDYTPEWLHLQMALRRNREAKNTPLMFRTIYSY